MGTVNHEVGIVDAGFVIGSGLDVVSSGLGATEVGPAILETPHGPVDGNRHGANATGIAGNRSTG